ncbi:MAG: hypothetical protein AB1631_12955 [Acidobacteriota bacterium]
MNTTARVFAQLTLGSAIAMALALVGNSEDVSTESHRRSDFCSQTARALYDACKAEVSDDGFRNKAVCINISNEEERAECFEEMEEEMEEGLRLCREQRDGRLDACKSLGEGRYDPDIDPALFDDDFANLTSPNPYFPLTVGNRWEYSGAGEFNTVEVANQTKLIEGVRCIVVRDQVFKDGDLVEDTDDWFAQARDGNVWYFGEEVKDFESFDGDNPRRPELVSIDGSFKWGRDGDKGGIFFFASPMQGKVHLEEFSLGNAEDVTEILSTTYRFGSNAELDRFVPQRLADRFCSAGDCVVTKNFSLLEPGIFARKYYARGIGFFLEIDPETGETIQLANCNFDPRCANLTRSRAQPRGGRSNRPGR